MKKIIYIVWLLLLGEFLQSQPAQINAWQYWFNDDYAGRITTGISPVTNFQLSTGISVASLKSGINILHIRFRDNNGRWSTPSGHFFSKSGPTITRYEYWFNHNYAGRITINPSAVDTLKLITALPTTSLGGGLNLLNIRYRDASGLWSPIESHRFWRAGPTLTHFEYWFDNKTQSKVTGSMAGEPTEEWVQSIMLNSSIGFDYLNVRFRDASKNWSSIVPLKTPVPKSDFFAMVDRNFVTFNNTSSLGKTFIWRFGDGTQSTQVNPSKTYIQPGEYFARLVARNIAGADSLQQQITIQGIASVVPDKAGDNGVATLTVNGGGLTPATKVTLTRIGFPDIVADTNYIVSPGKLNARFNLSGKALGAYKVVVKVPQLPPMEASNAFTIEAGKANEFWAEVSGRDVVLVNRWQTFTVNYGNLGNNDLCVAPLWLLVSDIPGLEIEFLSKQIGLPSQTNPLWQAIADSVKPWFPIDSLGKVPFRARVYPIFIPRIQASETGSFTVRIKSPQNYRIMSWVNPDWYTDTKHSAAFRSCVMWAQAAALANGLVSIINTQIPGAGCVGSISLTLMNFGMSENTMGSVVYALTRAAIDCVWDVGQNIPIIKAYALTKEILSLAANIYDGYGVHADCKLKFPPDKLKDSPKIVVNSFDPNEIVGPSGYAALNYNLDNIAYPYIIYFENLKTATAPAQEVFIYDTLDLTKYDASSFYFGNIGFGNRIVYIESGLKQFTKDIDLRPSKNIILRINARFDTQTGVAQWSFASLDPITMGLTEDPFGGFLPPNVSSPEGEGYVSFTSKLKPNLPHATVISNKATIIFDLNAPINTNTWVNAIDRVPPVSRVNALPAQTTQTSFMVNWSGTDQHSGVRSYSVFVSKNGAAPEMWLIDTQKKQDLFNGIAVGNTYRFYSLATDSIGNKEVFSGSYHTSTTILPSSTDDKQGIVDYFRVYPNPARDQITVDLQITKQVEVKLIIKDVFGRQLLQQKYSATAGNVHQFLIDVSKFEKGPYICVLETPEGSVARKIMIQQ